MASWQNTLTSNKQRLSYLYKSGEMSDVTVVVGGNGESKQTFRLHKLILSMQSDVFLAMFYGSLPEKDRVEIIDINPAIFEIVIMYIYNEAFSVRSVDEAMETYYAAEKYNIVHLRTLCAAFITKCVSPGNIPILYTMPNILEAIKVKSRCDEILSEKTSVVLKSDNFVKSPLSLVKDILQLDQMSIESEAELFQYILKWAETARNTTRSSETLRTIMDPFLPHIRFLTMNVEEFLSGPARSGVLADFEKASILENLVEPGCRELPSWCNKNTSRITMRSLKVVPNHTCRFRDEKYCRMQYRFEQNESYAMDLNLTKGTLKFRGVSFYVKAIGTRKPKASLSVRGVALALFGDFKGIVSNQSTSAYDPNTTLMRCMLLKPFTMHSGDNHRISVHLQDCTFEYCSSIFPDATVIGNEHEFRLSCRSVTREGHFYEIFYN